MAPAPIVPLAGGQPKSALVSVSDTGIQLRTMEEMFLFARAVVESGLAPKAFDTQQKVLVAVQMGMELGLPPMAALQNICVINGRPSLWVNCHLPSGPRTAFKSSTG